ncbi:heparanase-like [Patella vulgata]|uniref:heparanase-like n=1 Tax=Patella vulgata TaxID=6465 RepID=UPI0024A901D8|nr:heparanase-like [Patella vulgata]
MTKDQRTSPNDANYPLTVADWDNLNHFVRNVGWDLIFGFNVFLRKNGQWDPTNAKELLEYTVKQGYKPAGYELGNEPNLFPSANAVSEKQLAKDFAAFKNIVSSSGVPPFLTIGPDTSGMTPPYLQNFLEAGGGDVVDVVTVHQYYTNGQTATLKDFTDRKLLDKFIPHVDSFVKTCNEKAPNKQCWLGETSSCYHGGAQNISDRYVAGFLWLDKLGLSALHGLQAVLRQEFYSGYYSLIDINLNPNPDYWLTLIYKRLVGSPVFDVTQTTDPNVRVYAHCTNVSSSIGYKPGSITVYIMNIGSVTVSVDIPFSSSKTQQRYILSPGDDNGLTSQFVKLNGNVLMLPNDYELPPLIPVFSSDTLQLEAYNMGFVVIPDAMKAECMQ